MPALVENGEEGCHTHEEVVGIRNIAADSEELHQVMVLAVDVAAYLEQSGQRQADSGIL